MQRMSETKVCTGDFAPPEPEFRAEFWETNFGRPEFWTRILESKCLTLLFPAKEAPSKIHPREIHLPKFTSKNSPQNSGRKIHIALLQGHFADEMSLFSPQNLHPREGNPLKHSVRIEEVFGTDVPRTFTIIRADIPGQNLGQAPRNLGKASLAKLVFGGTC